MAGKKVELTAEKIKRRDTRLRALKVILLVVVILLIMLYVILKLIYDVGSFTVTLDTSYELEGGLVIYESKEEKLCLDVLKAETLEFMTNITEAWIPKNIDNEADGSHNGNNYIAYTFYAENQGKEIINYWSSIIIDDVVKNADEAIRVKVIKDGVETTYAKVNKSTGEPEKGTVAFPEEDVVMLDKTENFKPGDINKYTVVIWIEGYDQQCVDDIIGGEVKMHMSLTEEHIEQQQ